MAFPTIPTVAGSKLKAVVQADTTATRTIDFTGLAQNVGDRIIVVCIAYQTSTGTNAAFSGWTNGFTEIHDSATSTTMAIGVAEKIITNPPEVGVSVTQAGTITGHAALIAMVISGTHSSTPSEVGGRGSSAAGGIVTSAFNPAGWDTPEETLWILVGAHGETSLTGSYTGIGTGTPSPFGNVAKTGMSGDVIGAVEGGVAFNQSTSASDLGTAWSGTDTSNARGAAVMIAVRPAAAIAPTTITPIGSKSPTASKTAQLTVVNPPTTITPVGSKSPTASKTAQLVSPGTPLGVTNLAGTTASSVNLTWTAPAGTQ
jgi:hypothetical protein